MLLNLKNISIIDSGVDHSNHKPICGFFDISFDLNVAESAKNSPMVGYNSYSLSWDKSNLNDYYNVSRDLLSNIIFDTNLSHCDHNCKSCLHVDIINDYYRRIVHALINVEEQTISHVPLRALRPFWNDELYRLNQKSLFLFNLWRENGSPSSGHIHHIKCSTKLQYKKAIENAYLDYEGKHYDEIYIHFINKKILDFWKSWNSNLKINLIPLFPLMILQTINLLQIVLVIILHPYMLTPLII